MSGCNAGLRSLEVQVGEKSFCWAECSKAAFQEKEYCNGILVLG